MRSFRSATDGLDIAKSPLSIPLLEPLPLSLMRITLVVSYSNRPEKDNPHPVLEPEAAIDRHIHRDQRQTSSPHENSLFPSTGLSLTVFSKIKRDVSYPIFWPIQEPMVVPKSWWRGQDSWLSQQATQSQRKHTKSTTRCSSQVLGYPQQGLVDTKGASGIR